LIALKLNHPEIFIGQLVEALSFAAEKHLHQRRKNPERTPYINHLITVLEILWLVGQVRDETTLIASVLHDSIEDTNTTADEIREQFGDLVAKMVLEVTDDKSLPKAERKQLQIEHAPHISDGAKLIKLADKISNVQDMYYKPPSGWPLSRRREYVDWSVDVVAGVRGINAAMEAQFDEAVQKAVTIFEEERLANEK
jgi:guanosine-3',5'-bis(diphosphate) 3'-pyrophosphohydrolase